MKPSVVSDAELEVLKVLWTLGPATVRQIAGQLRRQKRRLAYTTVLTLVTRLRAKGYVSADRSGTAHIFRPRVTREELLSQGLANLAERICDGTASPLVQALVTGSQFSPEEIAHFRQLLDALERKD